MAKHPATIGKYEILTPIGAGGMARVYLGRQTGLAGFEKIVVIKAIHAHLGTETRFVDMFLDEARIAAQINHPNVAQVYDLGKEDGQYYLVMEYVPGEALNSVIVTGLKQKQPMTPKVAARIVAWAAEGLHAAHELRNMAGETLDVVHRDITPGNIIALYQGGAKVVDFGIAKARGRLTKTETEGLKGKLSYLSPEQLDEETVDRRSDIFALGIVLWELLALKRLFQRRHPAAAIKAILEDPIPPPSSVRPGVPRALDEIVLRALERNPRDRYQTAQEMQAALERGRLPSTIVVAAYMKNLFAQRIERRQALLKRLATGGRLDSKELEAVAEGFHVDDSGSVSLPSVDLSELRADTGRSGTAELGEDAITTAETSLDDIDIDVEVPGVSTTQEVPTLDEEKPAGATTLDEERPAGATTLDEEARAEEKTPPLAITPADVPTDATVVAAVPEDVLALMATAAAEAAEVEPPRASRGAGKRPWIVVGVASLFLVVVLVLLFVLGPTGPGAEDVIETETVVETEIAPGEEVVEESGEVTNPDKNKRRLKRRKKRPPPPPPPKKPPPKKPSASTLFDAGVDK